MTFGSLQLPYSGKFTLGRRYNFRYRAAISKSLLIHGQIHGGIAQGVGQALLEQCFYESSTGQMLSGSLMDHAIPRADDFPSFKTVISEVPSPTHPLGMRPAGEAGTTPA